MANYVYAGRDRLLQKTDYAGVKQRYFTGVWNDALYYDGARRPVKLDFKMGAALLTGLEHGFDRADNRLYVRRLHDSSEGDNYVYDSKYRLLRIERDVGPSEVGAPGGSSFKERHLYDLDGVHNRGRVIRHTQGLLGQTTLYTVDAVNNYVSKKQGLAAPVVQSFDLNGNKQSFTQAGTHSVYKYDFLNRLRSVEKGASKVEFDYDAEGRRVRTKATNLAGSPASTEFIHDGPHVIEELDGNTGACMRRFYYGDGLDELVGYENLAFYPGPGAYFYQQDSHGDVVAIHNVSGAVVERYTYAAFGSPQFETPGNVKKAITRSDFGNPYAFAGMRHEYYFDELYYCRARFVDCADGTFMQRDPIGVWGDWINVGNSKAYCGNNPATHRDPLGRNVYLTDRDMDFLGAGLFPSHQGITITPAGRAPGEAKGKGNDTSYAGYHSGDNYPASGGLVVHKDGMKDQGYESDSEGAAEDKSANSTELEPPEGVSQEDWDQAFRDAGESQLDYRGGTVFRKGKDGKVRRRKVPTKRTRGYGLFTDPNCRDFAGWMIDSAVSKLIAQGKLPNGFKYKKPRTKAK